MDAILRDIRYAARALATRPAHTLVIVATMTIVIGAATAVLAVVNASFIRPLPYPAGDRLAQLFLMPPGQNDWSSRNPQSLGSFLRFRENLKQTELVEGLWSRERVLSGDAEPEVVIAGAVSAGLFGLFGGHASMGRTFTEEEDRTDAKVVVLGHGIWQRRFGADPSVLHKTVEIDRDGYEVIGVMPPDFKTGFVSTDLWTPLNATEADIPSGNTVVQTFTRLKPGVSVHQLQGELAPVMEVAAAENAAALKGWTARVVNLREAQYMLQRPSLLALAGGVAALLLIACANLANLTLLQVVSRRSELAVRAALGAGRAVLIRLQLIETVLPIAMGSLAGLLLGRWVLPVLLALDPSLSRTFGEISIDWRVQLAVAMSATLVAIGAGALPLLRELRRDLAGAMSAGSRRIAGSRHERRLRSMLVSAECALSVVLIASAALLLSAFDRTAKLNPGFDSESVLTAQLRLSATAYPTEAARAEFIARVLDQVRSVPGVVSAGATLNRFVPGFFMLTRVHIETNPTPDGQPRVVHFRRASLASFSTMGIPVLQGRDFAATDRLDQPLVAIVSRQFANEFWPGKDPIGQRLRRGTGPKPLTVIGVVGDVSDVALSQAPAATVYVPFSQNNVAVTPVSLVIRTAGDPLALGPSIRAAVFAIDPAQPIDSLNTLDQFLADSLGPQRFRTTLLLVLGAIGVALAALGIYGITSRSVAEQTSELGVRLALGASPASVARLVAGQSMRAVVAGLAIGGALAVAAATAILKLLPEVEQATPWMTAPAVVALAVVALAAALIPARRATLLGPLAALRSE